LSPLLVEFNDTLDLSEYSKEYPWPLDYLIFLKDKLKTKKFLERKKDIKEILGIIDKYVTSEKDKTLTDYWIYCSMHAIYKCKDEELQLVLKGCKGIQEFMLKFPTLL